MNMKNWITLGIAVLGFAPALMAQEKAKNPRIENSIRPIYDENIHYRARLWRRMDLNEKINQPFFSSNNEISKFLLEGVRAGLLTPYKNDSLSSKLTLAQFEENLKIEEQDNEAQLSDAEVAAGFGDEKKAGAATAGSDDGWGGSPSSTPKAETAPAANDGFAKPAASPQVAASYFAKELSILEIQEDAIIDKQRSRLYFDIQSLTLVVPASKTKAGFDKPIASFQYKEVYKYFKSNPNCIWYNAINEMQHKNMADAFDLRLFQARIIKKGNAGNQYLTDIYKGDKEGLLMSQMIEHQLLELENNLWEN